MEPWEQYSAPKATEQEPWEQFASQQNVDQQPDKSLVVGDIFTKRANELADNVVAYKNDEISKPELALRFIGKAGAGTANDLMGAGVNALIPETVKQGLAKGAQGVAGAIDNTNIGQYLGDKLLSAHDAYSQFSEQNPRLMENIESTANIASFVPAAQSIQSAGRFIKSAAPVINKIESASRNLPGVLGDVKSGGKVSKPVLSDEVARMAAKNAYQDVEILGGQFTPQLADDAHGIIQRSKVKPFAGDILTKQDRSINEALADYDSLAGKSLSLDDYKRLDSSLGDKAAEAFVNGRVNEGRIVSNAQDEIRDLVKPGKLGTQYVSGSREGIDALTNDAIPLWAAQAKLKDIVRIHDRAMVMDNPSTAIRTGYRNLMLSKRFSTYPKNVQKLIIKAANTGIVDDLLGVVGSRLNQIAGASIGGAPGFAVSTTTSAGARGIRNAIRYRRADKVMQGVLEPVRPSIEKYGFAPAEDVSKLTMQEIMKMPPAQARAALAQMKTARAAP